MFNPCNIFIFSIDTNDYVNVYVVCSIYVLATILKNSGYAPVHK